MNLPLAPTMSLESQTLVRVDAPGRLHLGFLDPSATLGRRFGSVGLVIEGPQTRVEISAAATDELLADAPAAQAELARAREHLASLRRQSGRKTALRLRLAQVLPAHAGLGSGTQLALALGTAFVRWHGLDQDTSTLAQWLERGLRSGVGIAGFDHGGLLVDGGRGDGPEPAPLLARVDLPSAWRIVLVQDPNRHGLSGAQEKQAIGALAALPRSLAADICHQVLMRVLPGAAGNDFAIFAAGVNRMQLLLGEHFAPAQGGSAYTSAAVGQLVQWLGAHAPHAAPHGSGTAALSPAVGQSSWGPTGFAIFATAADARAALQAAREAGQVDPALDISIVCARNRGAMVHDTRGGRP